MSICACGKTASTFGGFCDRCAALQTLGLPMYSTPAEIEDAYRTMVKVWHPDRFQSDQKLRVAAEERLKEINAAHDYLTSGPAVETPRYRAAGPEPITEEEEEEELPEEMYEEPEPAGEQLAELKRLLKRYRRRAGLGIFTRLFFVGGGLVAIAFLWFTLDFALSSNAKTERSWDEFKTETARDMHATAVRLWGDATDDLHSSKGQASQPAAVPIPSQEAAAKDESADRTKEPAKAAAPTRVAGGAKPYITTGLSPTEVLGVLGNPSSSSGEKMFYHGSEIDFRDGHVAGWKIDPTSPIRVKLWPDQPLTPGVRAFAVGSPKSDVIALQGTPTLLSDNEFGYGGSVVYFKNDRVSSWQEAPNSVKLRVAQ